MSKEMIYRRERHEPDLLASGMYQFFRYAVISLGTHPCAYVQIPQGHPLYKAKTEEIEDAVSCHGGITYTGDRGQNVPGLDAGGFWIGWDYAHYGDRLGFAPDLSGHAWTTEELLDECRSVIDQLDACL